MRFAATTHVRMQHVPYKGSSEAVTALVGHQLDLTFDNLTPTSAMIKAGKLRALDVTSPQRSALMPDVPTTAELGVPVEASSWWGLLAPAGIEPFRCSPAEFKAYIKSETDKWTEVSRKANIRVE